MLRRTKTLSGDIVKSWPEVFGEVRLTVLPLRYLKSILISFKDNTIWEVKITPAVKKSGWDELEKTLIELIKEYEDNIDNIDFKLDTEKVKKDITKKTQKFLKNKKIQ